MEAKKILRKYEYERFNISELRKLARDGRLFFDANEPTDEALISDRVKKVMEYVESIRECVSPTYVPYIDNVWNMIVTDDRLNKMLFYVKGKNRGLPNRNRIMVITVVLLNLGVYDKQYSAYALHNRLQHTNRKDSVYTSQCSYEMSHDVQVYLRRQLKKIIEKN